MSGELQSSHRAGRRRLVYLAVALLGACASMQSYHPQPGDAFLVDDRQLLSTVNDSDASVVAVARIDDSRAPPQRLRIEGAAPDGGDLAVLRIEPGQHTVKIQVCEAGFWTYCGTAYVELTANPGEFYRVYSSMSKTGGYIEVWIEELYSSHSVVPRMRFTGLTRHG
ncbi:hypothetical protein E4634_20505 [Mangrovimicrobium sediminis]|uniref:Uncharacterized protein n=1 Tax=Mangrovimicrobium sediminis TaxID=2562682 RepID=A0A4Z0LU89_9GAMM|nr:hypothetical protein [Haliea sp. SAOS-164]TGD70983.1 hypothetical protein E4634_20505 [Haliea sp. SAOS-164]